MSKLGQKIHIRRRIRERWIAHVKRPETFNEKIIYRKYHWKNPLFVTCADKIAVKEYVRGIVGDECIIPTVYSGRSVNVETLRTLVSSHGRLAVKQNHDSGSVQFVGPQDSDEDLRKVCARQARFSKRKFGTRAHESWYDKIDPATLVEQRVNCDGDGTSIPDDYKFHVFSQGDEQKPAIIFQIDSNRFQPTHHQSFFDEDLNWLPFFIQYPCLHTRIDPPLAYREMLQCVKVLARPFSYTRIDLYACRSHFYFGEMTFSHDAGIGRFSDPAYDRWMGALWSGDPRY